MKSPLCDLLDGYLGEWLSGEEQAQFAAHLEQCAACRQSVAEEQRLNALLVQAIETEPLPAGLIERIEKKLNRPQRRRLAMWVAGISAAAAVLLGTVLLLLSKRAPETQSFPAPVVEVRPEPPATPPAVAVTFPRSSEVIALPMPSKNPTVTIIWVYPTVPIHATAGQAVTGSALPAERSDT